MRYTIKDIACRAGVSHVTVSRILSNSNARHSTATREKVQAIAKELGYQPNTMAKIMRGRKNMIIGIAARNNMQIGHFQLLEKCILEITKRNYVPMMLDLRVLNSGNTADIMSLLSGMICETRVQLDNLTKFVGGKEFSGPVVMLRKDTAVRQRFVNVHYDSSSGMQMLTDYLITKGHKEMIWVGADEYNPRECSFRSYAEANSININYVHISPQSSIDNFHCGLYAVPEILKYTKSTVVVCSNDEFALGVISGLAASGLRIPQDMAVTGFENMAFGAVANPPLTTVDVKPEQVASLAVEKIISMIENPKLILKQKDYAIKPSLIVRAST